MKFLRIIKLSILYAFNFILFFRICSDNNIDNTNEILRAWLAEESEKYHTVDIYIDEKSNGFEDEESNTDWSLLRFTHVINLRQEALNYARKIWADFIWVILNVKMLYIYIKLQENCVLSS